MKQNIIINGSTRKNGNTDEIINLIVEQATSTTSLTQIINLRELSVSDCNGCHVCHSKKQCSISDDMTNIIKLINNAETLIFASPVYWWSVTGIMKIFIDRLYYYHSETNKHLISGKKCALIAPMNMPSTNEKTNLFLSFYSILFNNLDLECTHSLLFDGLNEKGAFFDNKNHVSKALDFAKNIR
jgi:multimeric flavodoxin WrbA